MKYLYGASIQGIQSFIFETNKLKEIAGASELVESICTDFFQECILEAGEYKEQNLLIGAAGNIKYLFDDRADCERFVYDFPRRVMQKAPGITISQAVVEVPGDLQKDSVKALEDLLKVQRNRAIVQHGAGWMISERARRTGAPGRHGKGKDIIDQAQHLKRKEVESGTDRLLKKIFTSKSSISRDQYPYEMEDIIEGRERGWVAVVHADGNNLGQKLILLIEELQEDHIKDAFRELSLRLEQSTVAAAAAAFSKIKADFKLHSRKKLPIRPVILGGDDLTIIIDGKLAIPFTQAFLKAFEENTRLQFADFKQRFGTNLFEQGLTACAGIAFVKPSYPFHFAVSLSDSLCKHTKKIAKTFTGAPSSLMFHKVHSSFIGEYTEIIDRELSTPNFRFNYGPYFLAPQTKYASIDQLLKWVEIANEKNAPTAPVRNWLTELEVNEERAEQEMKRIITLNKNYRHKLQLDPCYVERGNKKYTHLFDLLSLSAIQK